MLSVASLLLSGCHCPVWGRICSLVAGVEAPSSISELHFFLKIYLFILFLAVLGLCCCEWAFSNCGEMRLLSSCGTRAVLRHVSTVVAAHGLSKYGTWA